ncbi:MAG: hypothetical protein OXT69_07820 [Candidatus Poribacteria bacterium]|nr:hypothetical protein [Candidatus Poribacteria bacterium]
MKFLRLRLFYRSCVNAIADKFDRFLDFNPPPAQDDGLTGFFWQNLFAPPDSVR